MYITAGEYGEGDVVCTTLPVVVATGAAVVFLQLCILVTCILCIYTARRGKQVGLLNVYQIYCLSKKS